MKEEILGLLNDPRLLEKLYRNNKLRFKREFSLLYPTLKGNTIAEYWHERLYYENDEVSLGSGKDLMLVILASIVAGLLAKLPAIFSINEEFFYPRNIGFIVFPLLSVYFAWKNKLSAGKLIFIAVVTIVSILYINILPDVNTSDTLILSCIHMVLLQWSLLGFSFVGERGNNTEKRLNFLKYNGDLLVMTGLILIAGAILTGVTIGLFSLIGLNIEEFYFKNIVVFVLPSAPLLGTYLTQTNPQLVGKVSPVIAKIFSPLVVVMLIVYLAAIIYAGKDPYTNRDFLMLFNALLIGVMALIFFSVAETAKSGKTTSGTWILFILSVITIIVNGIALTAILFRISEWGITPNRAAVMGGNMLILIHLLIVAVQLFLTLSKKADISQVQKAIAVYLPVYMIWSFVVTFIFPLIFGFR
jgi:hypothetical protein